MLSEILSMLVGFRYTDILCGTDYHTVGLQRRRIVWTDDYTTSLKSVLTKRASYAKTVGALSKRVLSVNLAEHAHQFQCRVRSLCLAMYHKRKQRAGTETYPTMKLNLWIDCKNLFEISRVKDGMLNKTALLVLLGLGASVALADDLDALIELEDQVKARFDHQLNLRKIKYILDGVSRACLEHRCFSEGSLKIKVETNCQDCRVDVDLGGVEYIVPANGEWKLLDGCIKIGKPGNCHCQSLTRLHIDKQLNAKNIIINAVELSLVTADGSKTIFKGKRRRLNSVAYELGDIKNSDTFIRAKVGSCQN